MSHALRQAAEETISCLDEASYGMGNYNPDSIIKRYVEATRQLDDVRNDMNTYYDFVTVLEPIDASMQFKLGQYIAKAAYCASKPEWAVEQLLLKTLSRHKITDIIKGEYMEAVLFLARYGIGAWKA